MKVTIEIKDYTKVGDPSSVLIVRNACNNSGRVELELDGKTYTANAEELKSAIDRATLNCFGR